MSAKARVQTSFASKGIQATYTNVALASQAPQDYAATAWNVSTATTTTHTVHVFITAQVVIRRSPTGHDETESTVLMPAYDFKPRIGDKLTLSASGEEFAVTAITISRDTSEPIMYEFRTRS